jgi:hypothetical protein
VSSNRDGQGSRRVAIVDNDSHVLLMSEYEAATAHFFSTGVKELMEAQGGVYSLVSKEHIEQLPDYSLALPGGDVLGSRPIEAISSFTINRDDVINEDIDSVLNAMYGMAIEMAGQITRAILTHISEICDHTGNIVSGKLSYDTIADAIEQMEFSFDEDGNHNISVVVSPDGAERLRALGDPTVEQRARLDGIFSRRKDEWDARRSSRSLPSRRH